MELFRVFMRLAVQAQRLRQGRRPSREFIGGLLIAAAIVILALVLNSVLHLPAGAPGSGLSLRPLR